jgi:hypothetical protein
MEQAPAATLRLIFVGSAEPVSTDYTRGTMDLAMPGAAPRADLWTEGASPTEILDAWNALPAWADLEPLAFRETIVRFCGAEIELPAADEEILDALIAAAGPDALRLKR